MTTSAGSTSRFNFGDVAVDKTFMKMLDSRSRTNLLVLSLGLESSVGMMEDLLASASITMWLFEVGKYVKGLVEKFRCDDEHCGRLCGSRVLECNNKLGSCGSTFACITEGFVSGSLVPLFVARVAERALSRVIGVLLNRASSASFVPSNIDTIN